MKPYRRIVDGREDAKGLVNQKHGNEGKKEKNLTDDIGITPGAMSKWKYDGSFVYIKYIYESCEFLDTTPNYLFLGRKTEMKGFRSRKRRWSGSIGASMLEGRNALRKH